jgi:hypothetical protein
MNAPLPYFASQVANFTAHDWKSTPVFAVQPEFHRYLPKHITLPHRPSRL